MHWHTGQEDLMERVQVIGQERVEAHLEESTKSYPLDHQESLSMVFLDLWKSLMIEGKPLNLTVPQLLHP